MSPNLAALVIFHITAGGFGLVAGGTALFVRKGAWLHRTAGNVFFVAMLLMAASGASLAVLTPAAPALNLVIAGLTIYLVATSWATVLRQEGEAGVFEVGALLVALAVGAGGLIAGLQAASSPTGGLDGIPALLFFFFGGVAVLAGLLDISVLVRRGVSGAQRIARHLWRMCLALLVASLAFFVGQAAFLPAWVREMKLNFVPLIAVVVLLLFWLLRVLLTGWYKRQPTQITGQTADPVS